MVEEHDVCNAHSGIVTEIATLKESDVNQWAAIDKLRNRLPVWATVVISLLTFLLGYSIGFNGLK